MCLCVIEKRFKPNQRIREAYKCFYQDSAGKLRGIRYGSEYAYQKGVWLTADEGTLEVGDPPPGLDERQRREWFEAGHKNGFPQYPQGFHAFELQEDAYKYRSSAVVLKVLLKDTRVVGKEYFYSTILPPTKGLVFVARQMLITEMKF